MTEITSRLSTALADHYKIERHLCEGGMASGCLDCGEPAFRRVQLFRFSIYLTEGLR